MSLFVFKQSVVCLTKVGVIYFLISKCFPGADLEILKFPKREKERESRRVCIFRQLTSLTWPDWFLDLSSHWYIHLRRTDVGSGFSDIWVLAAVRLKQRNTHGYSTSEARDKFYRTRSVIVSKCWNINSLWNLGQYLNRFLLLSRLFLWHSCSLLVSRLSVSVYTLPSLPFSFPTSSPVLLIYFSCSASLLLMGKMFQGSKNKVEIP